MKVWFGMKEQRSGAPADVQTGEPWLHCRIIRHRPLLLILGHTHRRSIRTLVAALCDLTYVNKTKSKCLKCKTLKNDCCICIFLFCFIQVGFRVLC